jgi:HAD superfamily phosphoserine phosphatase-like hydrolase
MKKLAVIDFDKTLLTIDSSFHFLLKHSLIGLVIYGLLRKLHLISRKSLAKSIVMKVDSMADDLILKYVTYLESKVNPFIENEITKLRSEGVEVIVLSGSADKYVKEFCKLYNIQGFGSKFDLNGKFLYLYGDKKSEFVREYFKGYQYFYTVSDSESDKPLFEMFEKAYILSKNNLVKI